MERLKMAINIVAIVLLSINLYQSHGLRYDFNKLNEQQQQTIPTIELHLQKIDSSINKWNDIHPSLVKGKK